LRRVLLVFLLLPALALAQDMVTRDGVTLTQAQEAHAEAIGDQLRCLVCQNESIEDSNAKLAGQLRSIIRTQVVQGVPDKSIMDYMVQRYGIFVLLKPPVSRLTYLLYAMPGLALLAGLAAFWFGRTKNAAAAPLNDDETARLEVLLRE
jgi:cytochrome c-type biogenesis protein CcmH